MTDKMTDELDNIDDFDFDLETVDDMEEADMTDEQIENARTQLAAEMLEWTTNVVSTRMKSDDVYDATKKQEVIDAIDIMNDTLSRLGLLLTPEASMQKSFTPDRRAD